LIVLSKTIFTQRYAACNANIPVTVSSADFFRVIFGGHFPGQSSPKLAVRHRSLFHPPFPPLKRPPPKANDKETIGFKILGTPVENHLKVF
jgi:hypothetical protein